MRPEQLHPAQFIDLTIDIFGARGSESSNAALLVTPVALINGAENKNLAKVLLNSGGAKDKRADKSADKNTVEDRKSGKKNAAGAGKKSADVGLAGAGTSVAAASKRLLEVIKTRRDRKIEASRTDGEVNSSESATVESDVMTEDAEKKGGVDKSMYLSDAVWRKALYG